jgi:hypothetical protein
VSLLPQGLRKDRIPEAAIFLQPQSHPEHRTLSARRFVQGLSSMFELAAALITLFSASIFLAHAVEAYYAK